MRDPRDGSELRTRPSNPWRIVARIRDAPRATLRRAWSWAPASASSGGTLPFGALPLSFLSGGLRPVRASLVGAVASQPARRDGRDDQAPGPTGLAVGDIRGGRKGGTARSRAGSSSTRQGSVDVGRGHRPRSKFRPGTFSRRASFSPSSVLSPTPVTAPAASVDAVASGDARQDAERNDRARRDRRRGSRRGRCRR